MNNVLRVMIFVVLFGVGAGALGMTILCEDLSDYYQNRRTLARAHFMLDILQQLNMDYDALLVRIEKEPSELKRLAPAVLGNMVSEPNVAFPEAGLEQRMVAKQALAVQKKPGRLPSVPNWLQRITPPHRRRSLFLAGGALVLISFVWFGLVQRKIRP